jgi:hypothetical protein
MYQACVRAGAYLVDLKNFTIRLLHAVKHGHVIPKAGLRDNFVGGKNVHLEDIRFAGTLLLRRLQSTNNLPESESRLLSVLSYLMRKLGLLFEWNDKA